MQTELTGLGGGTQVEVVQGETGLTGMVLGFQRVVQDVVAGFQVVLIVAGR